MVRSNAVATATLAAVMMVLSRRELKLFTTIEMSFMRGLQTNLASMRLKYVSCARSGMRLSASGLNKRINLDDPFKARLHGAVMAGAQQSRARLAARLLN